ncbi:MAG: polysaccharide biosynthesis protein [Bacteroidales bacterium]|nr:polysaccharide biosynthesis protein [Candidatus Liminaster caballi]
MKIKLSGSDLVHKLTSWYFTRGALPYWCVLLMDCSIIVFAELVAYYLSFGGSSTASHFWSVLGTTICTVPAFLVGMRLFNTYSGIFRYSSFVDLLRVTCALLVGVAVLAAARFVLYICHVDFFVDQSLLTDVTALFFAMMGMWSVRILVKYLFDTCYKDKSAPHVFIYGVRYGGISLAKSIRNEHPLPYLVKGFVSDDPSLTGRFLLGTRVYMNDETLIEHIKKNNIKLLFVSPLHSEDFRSNDAMQKMLISAGVKIMMVPSAQKWDEKQGLRHEQLHEVDIEDLLPRDKIEVDLDAIGALLKGKRILITGAAGSIGSEMVRQVAKFEPEKLVLVDQAETPMHDVRLYMQRNHPDINAYTIVGSISNQTHMEQIFSEHRPDYVFHAAAYKHVPMMEDNPAMAIQNNTYGTRVIADLAVKYGTKKFVMISTDKAVNPTNVMGCSKRICEIYCQSLNASIVAQSAEGAEVKHVQSDGTPAVTQFITTRFGNVLGSNGSVIPIFKEQIKKGGPVTVTHPDIIRFFMLIPEACRLVLEAGTMGKGGEIFVFDMGKPVRIADLAQRMIDLSGAKNVQIQYSGLRDGEKLYEEVLNDKEITLPTPHPKIKVAKVREYQYDEALRDEEELYRLSFTYDDMAIVGKMKQIVPEYRSQHSKYEVLDKK